MCCKEKLTKSCKLNDSNGNVSWRKLRLFAFMLFRDMKWYLFLITSCAMTKVGPWLPELFLNTFSSFEFAARGDWILPARRVCLSDLSATFCLMAFFFSKRFLGLCKQQNLVNVRSLSLCHIHFDQKALYLTSHMQWIKSIYVEFKGLHAKGEDTWI